MDGELFKFLGVSALFLVILTILRRRLAPDVLRKGDKASDQPPAAPRDVDAQLMADRLARIRSSAAEASLPPARSFGETIALPVPADPDSAVERSRSQAIVFRQHMPPRADARSYWGGLPSLPDSVDWPRFTTPAGIERPLSFILQIDCASLPAEGLLALMPSRGLLLFFAELEWGKYWQWRVIHVDCVPDEPGLATPPADLPQLYGDRGIWAWMRRNEDWPKLLPHFSFDPVLITGRFARPPEDEDEAEERKLWPGAISLEAELEALYGGIAETKHFENAYDEAGTLVRPFVNFPQDWRAVTISLGHLARELERHHLARFVKRGDMTQDEADRFVAAARRDIAQWLEIAFETKPFAPLAQTDSDAVWQLFVTYQKVALFCLTKAVNASLDATLSGSPDPLAVLPPEAVDLARARHALISRGKYGVHINTPDRMLSAPSCPQQEAAERTNEWLLLLEMSSNDGIGHHFGEGVLQFWIRPEDLGNRRFERVELTAEAY